ncbi:YuzD family protein [Lentibacillus halophilus]|uniref:YuzD family protein n=1 Tax=Lentibacillus halophilus TaxID=295065 RepID=A0ABN0Z235_9BACI
MAEHIQITVYGAEQLCASCVGAPGSRDTYEWLQAAIGRKYVDDNIDYEYVDIDHPPNVEAHKDFSRRIVEEEWFYPVVLVNGQVVAEGIPKLKPVYRELDKNGAVLQS